MDVFCSRKDWVALGFVVRVVGTTDTGSGAAAGRYGFQPKGEAALDPTASAKLRQHFWSAELAWTGHTGGHHGMHSPAFIHAYLFPLFGRRCGRASRVLDAKRTRSAFVDLPLEGERRRSRHWLAAGGG